MRLSPLAITTVSTGCSVHSIIRPALGREARIQLLEEVAVVEYSKSLSSSMVIPSNEAEAANEEQPSSPEVPFRMKTRTCSPRRRGHGFAGRQIEPNVDRQSACPRLTTHY